VETTISGRCKILKVQEIPKNTIIIYPKIKKRITINRNDFLKKKKTKNDINMRIKN